MTIKELREYLNQVPEEYQDFSVKIIDDRTAACEHLVEDVYFLGCSLILIIHMIEPVGWACEQ